MSPHPGEKRSLVARLGHVVREYGAFGGLVLMTSKLLTAVSRGHSRLFAYALVAQPISRQGLVPVRNDPHTVIQEVHIGDRLADHFPRPAAINAQRWATGAMCLAATVKNEFAGTLWFSRLQYAEDEVRCVYRLAEPARSVWDFDVFVAPCFRGGRLLLRMWHAANVRLAAEGVEWSFSRISLLNPASLTAHRRLGAVRVGTAAFWVIGGFQFSVLSMRPFVHLSVDAKSRPTIELPAPIPIAFTTNGTQR